MPSEQNKGTKMCSSGMYLVASQVASFMPPKIRWRCGPAVVNEKLTHMHLKTEAAELPMDRSLIFRIVDTTASTTDRRCSDAEKLLDVLLFCFCM